MRTFALGGAVLGLLACAPPRDHELVAGLGSGPPRSEDDESDDGVDDDEPLATDDGEDDGDASCIVGTLDCACTQSGACHAGLSCDAGRCTCASGQCETCGDGTCGKGEDCRTCADDCQCDPCGDGVCDLAIGETCLTCDRDCACADDPCAGLLDGSYCGAWLGAPSDSVYDCEGGVIIQITPCASGCAMCPAQAAVCKTDAAQRERDACGDPCAAAMFGNGTYCGSALTGSPDTLHVCTDGATTSIVECQFGCAQCDPLTPDVCKAFVGEPDASACG